MFDDDLAQASGALEQLSSALTELGRDITTFGLAGRVQLDPNDLSSSATNAAAWRELGLTHLSVITMDCGITNPRDHARLALDFLRVWRELSPVSS